MIPLTLALLLLGTVVKSRVTFQSSDLLQESDFVSSNRVAFHCINGCKLYSDSRSPDFFVTEYNNDTKQYDTIASFAEIGGASVQLLKPFMLPHSKNYFVENRGVNNPQPFVFYALDDAVNNTHATVRVLTDDSNFVIGSTQAKVTRVTVLSSKSAAVTYSHYGGAYSTEGYPRIYATGPDSVHNCRPVYQARNLENVYDSAITVFSPISTFDFGTLENHSVNVTFNKYGTIAKSPKSSVVYSSPGYIGCPYLTQTYTSPYYAQTVSDSFTLEAHRLIINAYVDLRAWNDAVLLSVNDQKFNIFNNPNFHKDFNDTNYAVDIKWRKNTPGASFSMQLDFDWDEV